MKSLAQILTNQDPASAAVSQGLQQNLPHQHHQLPGTLRGGGRMDASQRDADGLRNTQTDEEASLTVASVLLAVASIC